MPERSEGRLVASGGVASLSIVECGARTEYLAEVTESSLVHKRNCRSVERRFQFTATSTYSYTYDHAKQRVTSSNGTATTTYPNRYYSVEGSDVTKYIYAGDELVGQIDGTGTSTTTYYVHTDHLGGTNVLTNASSTEAQALDYYPFGAVRMNDDTDSVGVAKQFIGEYADTTDLSYLNARYYDGTAGRFTAQDPVARNNPEQVMGDPRQLNTYSYSRNNPINFLDPSGLLTVVIPGTFHNNTSNWYTNGTPETNFVSNVGQTFGETPVVLPWSGNDNPGARTQAAEFLNTYVSNYSFSEGERLNIVGHSHGGNVGIEYSQIGNRKVDNLVTLGTPARSDYKPKYDMIGNHVNAYSNLDPVQSLLGGRGGYAYGGTGFVNSFVNSFLYEFGPAGRTYGGETNDVSVTWQAGLPQSAHGNLIGNNSVWSKVESNIQ